MSIQRGEKYIDTIYVGIQKRKEGDGNVYSVTKNHEVVYGCPDITLTVGITYRFVIDCPGHPFYITTDDVGAGAMRQQSLDGAITITAENTGEKGNTGIEKGILTWSPHRDHSNLKLFYQCNYYPKMGGSIIVKIGD